MLSDDLTAVEILGLAIAQEVAAYKRYRLLAVRVSNPLVKEKFHSLAREEKAHQDMLYKMLQRATGEAKPPLPKRSPRLNKTQDADLPLHEVLTLAIGKEREAQAFYRDAAARTTDPTGRELLQYLSVFEEGHERSLQVELDALAKYPRWFDMEGPDILLVGP